MNVERIEDNGSTNEGPGSEEVAVERVSLETVFLKVVRAEKGEELERGGGRRWWSFA